MNNSRLRVLAFLSVPIVFGALIIFSLKTSIPVAAQSVGADCRDTNSNATNLGSQIPLTYGQSRYVTNPEKIFDSDVTSSGKIAVGQNKDYAYVAAKLPKRMAITKIDLKWAREGGETAPGTGWNLYTGFGSLIPEKSSSYSCYIGSLDKIGLNADGVSRSYIISAQPFMADYIVLTQAIAPNSNPVAGLISDIKVYGIEAKETNLDPNVLQGILTDEQNKTLRDVPIAVTDGSRTIKLDVTDKNGKYRINDIPKGTYDIKVLNVGSSAPSTEKVTFALNAGENQKKNLKVSPKKSYKLILFSSEYNITSDLYSNKRLKDVTYKVYTYPDKKLYAEVKNNNASAYALLNNIPKGQYTFQANKSGYKTNEITFNIANDSSIFVPIRRTKTNCKNYPSFGFNDVWVCGDVVSDADSPAFQDRLQKIVGWTARFKTEYNIPSMPSQIVVESSSVTNAFYSIPAGNPAVCPPQAIDEGDGPKNTDTLFVSSQYITQMPEYYAYLMVAHESGHIVDFYAGRCVPANSRSSQKDFVTLRNALKNNPTLFDTILKEGTYKGSDPTAGHPSANMYETYASLFNICYNFKPEFKQKLQAYPPDFQKVIGQMANISQEGKAKCFDGI
jgi:hypothetical protein